MAAFTTSITASTIARVSDWLSNTRPAPNTSRKDRNSIPRRRTLPTSASRTTVAPPPIAPTD